MNLDIPVYLQRAKYAQPYLTLRKLNAILRAMVVGTIALLSGVQPTIPTQASEVVHRPTGEKL